ncbi:MAG: hypothetical protein AB2A00_13660 [Myxococcota bacterium]
MDDVTARLVVGLLVVVVVFTLIRGLPRLGRGLREPTRPEAPFWLVRGIRDVVVAVACACIAAGLAMDSRAAWVFGLVFLGEELYETGVILLILHLRERLRSRAASHA